MLMMSNWLLEPLAASSIIDMFQMAVAVVGN
jgi:hypothetical protein